jgi:hypothetical protein
MDCSESGAKVSMRPSEEIILLPVIEPLLLLGTKGDSFSGHRRGWELHRLERSQTSSEKSSHEREGDERADNESLESFVLVSPLLVR